MSKSIFSAPHFNDEAAAYAYVEARLWANGRVCPHCGVVGESGKLQGKTNRLGLWKCYACRKPFSVKIGTIFEGSHIAMRDWLTAMHLICSSKKGISSNQIHRTLGITLKSAWFMSHRIREAMAPAKNAGPLGGPGEVVEADELYTGHKKGWRRGRVGVSDKMAVVSLVERGGRARSFHLESSPDALTITNLVTANVSPGSRLHTDESPLYREMKGHIAMHEKVNHSRKEYARKDVTTNSVEGYFSVFERGLVGTYQHVSERHLQRYLAEFDFRQSNRAKLGVTDDMRADRLLKGTEGKRLTYRTTDRNQGVA